MSLTQAALTIDCTDVARVSGFWSAALGRPIAPEASEFFAIIPPTGPEGLSWLFIAVPEPKTAKNRMHPDFHSTDRQADIERLLDLGAERVGDYDEWGTAWTTLRDVEGNEFCVAEHGPGQ